MSEPNSPGNPVESVANALATEVSASVRGISSAMTWIARSRILPSGHKFRVSAAPRAVSRKRKQDQSLRDRIGRRAIGTRPRLVQTQGPNATADMITTWFRNRCGSVGVIVDSNPFGTSIQELLTSRLPKARIDRYDNGLKNEDSMYLFSACSLIKLIHQ